MDLDIDIEKLNDGKVKITYNGKEDDFKNRDGQVIGKSQTISVIVLNDKESGINHLEGELKFLDENLKPIEDKLSNITFDEDKFKDLSEAIIKNGTTTVSKYKKLNNLVETYSNIKNLKQNKKFLLEQKEKIQKQLDLLKNV